MLIAKDAWHIIDAQGQILGRLASRLALVLMGKNKPTYTRHVPSRNHIIVINASKIRVTGRKLDDKIYKYYSGFPSGLRELPLKRVLEKDVTRPIKEAVWGMLPKTAMGHDLRTKLFVYAGAEHPHKAQNPQVLAAPAGRSNLKVVK
jgi:large subunit ribosomal protein L13